MAKRTKEILKEYFASDAVPTGAQFAELIDSTEDSLAPKTVEAVTGSITRTQRRIRIDTEDKAASDDLDTISGASDGDEIIILAEEVSRPVTLKNGTGNLNIGSDLILNTVTATMHMIYDANQLKWIELSRST